jgi:hypothetical protein
MDLLSHHNPARGEKDRLSLALIYGEGPMPRVLSYSEALAQDGSDTLNSFEHLTPQNSNGVSGSTVL